MAEYYFNVEVPVNKLQEFKSVCDSLVEKTKNERGCISFSVHEHTMKGFNIQIVSQWDMDDLMKKHFCGKCFGVLVGASNVLGNSNELKISGNIKDNIFKNIRIDNIKINLC